MTTKIVFLILLIVGIMEIFFNLFSTLIIYLLYDGNKDVLEGKIGTSIKLTFVIIFFVSVVYFLFQFVIVMANLFGISLDKRFIDIFK